MSIIRKLSDSFESWAPIWMSQRDGKDTLFKFVWACLYPLDILYEGILLTAMSAMPGLTSSDIALAAVGRSRKIIRGEGETTADYAARLRGWLEAHKDRGAPLLLARLLNLYLANHPRVSIITRHGDWYICQADGTPLVILAADAAWPWNWDGLSNPERATYWADMWIAIYPCEWPKTVGLRKSHELGLGHSVGRKAVSEIVNLIIDWTGAHTNVRAIIWVYDANLFDPAIVDAGNPDGRWGLWAKTVSGHQVASRNSAVRIWEPRVW